ncbi:MAG: hypothetical protein JSR21_17990 [Proteobacteria bacterium]|nr:hypothetical protein [Pseudomonadota bacterium]
MMRPNAMLAPSIGTLRAATLAAALAAMPVLGAQAMTACQGELSSTLLKPLPSPPVVHIDMQTSTPTSTAQAQAFANGMRNAGATVAPGPQPGAVNLRLTWNVLPQGGSGGGQGGGGYPGGSEGFLSGGIARANPDIPSYDAFAPATPAQAGLLVFRAQATDPSSGATLWIGSVQCTLQGADNQTLAYQLGQAIGGAFGQRRSRVPM